MDDFEERLKESLSNAYDIERELGGGGMSRVFVATDRLLGRRIVIKLLSPELTAGVNRARFRREIQVAAQLQHPHIVTLLSAGEDGEIVYYTMPFIEGESLKSTVERGPLAVRDVIRVLYDVVDALAYAHAHGVVHRDIKPANILRSGNHALVTDFGVAKALNAAMASTAMTSTGMAIGTPAYMAPEQLAGDPAADHRVDIYAVGLLAYELLIGQSPFAAMSPQAVMAALLTVDPKPVHDIRKDVPRRLSAIIMHCLAKDPDDRPQSAESLLDSLDAIATTSGEIRTREHKVPLPPVTKGKKTKNVDMVAKTEKVDNAEPVEKRRSNRLLVGALALLIIGGLTAFLLSRGLLSKPTVATIQPPKTASAEAARAQSFGAPGATSKAVVAPPVMTAVDSMAIAAAVQKRLAQAAAAAKKPGQTAVNTDSLKKSLQREVTDSVAKAKAALAAAAPPVAPPVTPAAPVPSAPSGKRRLSIAQPAESKEQPAINTFSKALSDALRGSLDKGDAFSVVDQDPEVVVTPSYVGTGDTVKITVSVRDLRTSSTFGMRVISARVMPAYPQYYLAPIVQAVLKQLDDLTRAPSIFGH
jgi:eukaryotic-like serine/threonine-protein kinase